MLLHLLSQPYEPIQHLRFRVVETERPPLEHALHIIGKHVPLQVFCCSSREQFLD